MTAVRQIVHRAREHVAALGGGRAGPSTCGRDPWKRSVVFHSGPAVTGALQSLLDILAPDVVLLGDGGGIKQAVPRPIVGPEGGPPAGHRAGQDRRRGVAAAAQVNGYPALILRLNGEIDTVMAVRVDDGLVTGLYAVRNPEKLSHMHRETTLRR